MRIESLAEALEREHRDIDTGVAAFTAGSPSGDRERHALTRAIRALRRHIYLEEAFLFPLLHEAEPGLAAPVFVMLREHAQIWDTLGSVEHEMDRGADAGLTACGRLSAQLLQHNLKEEKILYPRADDVLPSPAAGRLRAFLGSGQLPPGWVCLLKARRAAS